MAGKCPEHLEAEFVADVLSGMTEKQLAQKYKRVRRTITEWKRKLRAEGKLRSSSEDEQPGETLSFREVGNYAEASSQGERIITLDQLLDAAEVDLDVWQVRDWGVKKWEVGAKIKLADLQYDQGKADGWIQHRGLGIQDLWSVWAKLSRRKPIAIHPVIQPVECSVTFKKPERPAHNGLQRAVIGSDAQVGYRQEYPGSKLTPFHDRGALDLFLQVLAYTEPGLIIILGDYLDLTEWTDKFVRSPEFQRMTKPAILEGHWWLRQMRETCPKARIELHEGNHEKRMRNYMATHLMAAYDLKAADEIELPPSMSVPRLLALDSLGIEWVGDYPDDLSMINPALQVYHGDRISSAPGGTARAVLDQFDTSTIFGHGHSRESASRTTERGRTIEAHGIGTLCRIDGPVPARSKRNNWQQSLGIVDYDQADYSIYDLEIRNGRLVWDGSIFQAEDRLDGLRADLPGWNW